MSFMGKTLDYSYRFPNHDTIVVNIYAGDITVTDAVELDYSHSPFGFIAHDLTGYEITTTYNEANGANLADFNGSVFEDKYDVLNPIIGVALDTNIDGLDLSDISFTENSISTNWAGISFVDGSYATIIVTFAINQVVGTAGDDQLVGRMDEDVIRGGKGNDILQGMQDNDILYGGAGADILRGGQGDDILYGGTGDDILSGRSGDDTLFGGNGDDVLRGRLGDDRLDGGRGNDRLRGDAGADTFVFDTGSGRDTIIDFESGVDTIDLSGLRAIGNYVSLLKHATKHGNDLWITAGDDTLIIRAMDKADAGDFLF